jgi:hypothetical protein
MTYAEHQKFLTLINQNRSKIIISHYPCTLYEKELKHWTFIGVSDFNHGNVTKEKRIEGIWIN